MTFQEAVATITAFLTSDKLPHTGVGGFEGLVVALLEAETGQQFRLSGSGQQHGQDARSDDGIGNRIKVEAKHYRQSTLDLRELTAEVDQATYLGPDLDLWVLATSCRMKDQDAAALKTTARRHHIDLLVLDVGNDEIPKLPALMAAHREHVARWIELRQIDCDPATLQTALKELSTAPLFGQVISHIRQALKGALLGYEDARRRLQDAFLSMIRDRGNAKARFNQNVAIQAKDVEKIDRNSVLNSFVTWWRGAPTVRRAVAVGEEGNGKTWAVADWIARSIRDDEMPLVVCFSASAENIPKNETIEWLLPRLLRKLTAMGDDRDWERRIERWLRASDSKRPLILVFADGLNENAAVDWVSFFRTADHEEWREKVGVLLSDRPHHWRMQCAQRGLSGFKEIAIGGYQNSELEQVLERRGVAIGEIPPQLMELIRKPRYCDLVCEHFQELRSQWDFTVERLIFLDARYRAGERRGALTEAQFVTVLQNLAQQFLSNPTIKFGDVAALLPSAAADVNVYQEIVDGGLLKAKDDSGTAYFVVRKPLVYGVGMLLADEVRTSASSGASSAEVQDKLERWFEPDPEMEIKAEACGAALFHAYVNDDFPEVGRRLLLQYWLGLRNSAENLQRDFVHYVRRHPEDFVQAAELYWSGSRDAGRAQDLIAQAFVLHRDAPGVQSVLVRAVRRWLGFIHPQGHPAMRRDQTKDAQMQIEIQKRAADTLAGEAVLVHGRNLSIVRDDGLLQMSGLALLIISAGSRVPFIDGLVDWAVAKAIMKYSSESANVTWLVQLSPEPLEDLILPEVRKLLEIGDEVSISAARSLLWHLGTKSALELRDQHPQNRPEGLERYLQEHAADPCQGWFPWNDDDCIRCMERDDVDPSRIVERLGHRVLNPQFPVPSKLIQRIANALNLDPRAYHAADWKTIEEHYVEKAVSILASKSPSLICDFFRKVTQTIGAREPSAQYALAFKVVDYSLFFTEAEKSVVRSFVESAWGKLEAASDAEEQSLNPLQFIEAQCFCSLALHTTPDKLFEFLMQRPDKARDLEKLEMLFEALSPELAARALEILQSPRSEAALIRLLWYLPAAGLPSLAKKDQERIKLLVDSDSEIVRACVLRLVTLGSDTALAREVEALIGSRKVNDTSFESRWRNALLFRFAQALDIARLITLLHPSELSFALAERNPDANETDAFTDLLDDQLRSITLATEPQNLTIPSIVLDVCSPTPGERKIHFAEETDSARTKSISEALAAMSMDPESNAERLNNLAADNIAAITEAWKSDAYAWYGKRLSPVMIKRILESSKERVMSWIEPALGDGPTAELAWARLSTLLGDVCTVLLEVEPSTGVKLWKALRKHSRGPVLFAADELVFVAPDCSDINECRDVLLSESFDDYSLSRVASLAGRYERSQWLDGTIESLVANVLLWKRAQGLTLASLSDITPESFEELVAKSDVSGTWVEQRLGDLRVNVQRNAFAKHWYRIFAFSEDPDTSWGAWHVFLACADERFRVWRKDPDFKITDKQKRAFARIRMRDLPDRLAQKKERRALLFGTKIERGGILPFADLQ